jgi:hypothetical protein
MKQLAQMFSWIRTSPFWEQGQQQGRCFSVDCALHISAHVECWGLYVLMITFELRDTFKRKLRQLVCVNIALNPSGSSVHH